jgi:DNA-binding response OmpR family regulator
MVPIIVILTVVVFFLVDLGLRLALKKRDERKQREERREALETGLRLEFTDEAASLTRIEVDSPKARVLVVDDEPVVLESMRKILVMEGYCVDTVETAQEGLGLARKNDYDFVFTDLKMPGMDGVDLTKAVKHVRADIDVVIVTGYASVDSAVETMRHGAMDYFEKPFTADELATFTRKLLIRRQERLRQETPPTVHLVRPGASESKSREVINVPAGSFASTEHTWVGLEINGEARIGMDDLALKTLTGIEEVDFPAEGSTVRRGEPLFKVKRRGLCLTFASPIAGRVTRVHHELAYNLDLLGRRPFLSGWICCLEPENLTRDLAELKVGGDSIAWYESEVTRLRDAVAKRPAPREAGGTPVRASEAEPEAASDQDVDETWLAFDKCFLATHFEQVAV